MWEETLLTGNVDRLLNTRRSAHIHGRIPERSMLDDFAEEITETPETPAAANLFNTRDNNKQEILNKTWAQAFHHTLAQLLFTGIQCRKDAQTEI